MGIAKVVPAPRSRLCHEPLRVTLGSDPSPEPELSQHPTIHLCVCSELPWTLPNRGQRTHTRNVGSPVANTSSRRPVLNNACTSVLCSFDARFGFGLQPRLHMADCCLAILSAIDTEILQFCSSSHASPSIGAGSSSQVSCTTELADSHASTGRMERLLG